MFLSIIFPAYNEDQNIEFAVREALSFLQAKDGEVIVVNDGSEDKTREIVDQLAKTYPQKVRVIHHAKNLGYAATLRDGFSKASGQWIFYTDSDNQFRLSEIDLLLAESDGADIVIGYRKNRQDPWIRKFAAKVFNAIIRIIFGVRVKDVDCAFKLFDRSVFKKIKIESKGFLVDTEILTKAFRYGMLIREVGVTHLPRKFGHSTVRVRDVVRTLKGLLWLRTKIQEDIS